MFCSVIGIDLLRKMVNDFLSEKETVLEECRSEFETTPLGLDSLDLQQSPRKLVLSSILRFFNAFFYLFLSYMSGGEKTCAH